MTLMFRGAEYFPFGGGDVLSTVDTLHAYAIGHNGFSKVTVFSYNYLMLTPAWMCGPAGSFVASFSQRRH